MTFHKPKRCTGENDTEQGAQDNMTANLVTVNVLIIPETKPQERDVEESNRVITNLIINQLCVSG